jgi:hypothetical protein
MTPAITTVHTDQGIPFHVRIVREGDGYGRDDCQLHGERGSELRDGNRRVIPLVEFWDARYFEDEGGQFVARYYITTLREHLTDNPHRGLNMMDHEPSWKLDGCAFEIAMRAVEAALEDCA